MSEAAQMECRNCGAKFSRRKYSAAQRAVTKFCSRTCSVHHRHGDPVSRFMDAVSPEPNSGCWLWTRYVDRKGYGLVGNGTEQVFAHRFSYETFVGPLIAGLCICHRCDNPTCVNPDHLFQATHRENMDDMVRKRRHAFGSRHPNAKLNERDIDEIVFFSAMGMGPDNLASLYGVAARTIRKTILGANWSHVQ